MRQPEPTRWPPATSSCSPFRPRRAWPTNTTTPIPTPAWRGCSPTGPYNPPPAATMPCHAQRPDPRSRRPLHRLRHPRPAGHEPHGLRHLGPGLRHRGSAPEKPSQAPCCLAHAAVAIPHFVSCSRDCFFWSLRWSFFLGFARLVFGVPFRGSLLPARHPLRPCRRSPSLASGC